MQDNNTIHVTYAPDNKYAEVTCVSMASILYNTRNDVHFHIIENRLTNENKQKIQGLRESFHHGEWTFYKPINFDNQAFEAGPRHFTYEAYFRLLIPDMFPQLDRMIYLDGDTIIEKDINLLWNTDIGGKSLGASMDIQNIAKKKKTLFGIRDEINYFNSGVLLMDLCKLRESGLLSFANIVSVSGKLQTICKNNDLYNIWFVDQEVLNYLFKNDYYLLPRKYNLHIQYYHPDNIESNGMTLQEWKDALVNPVVIHYTGSHKPDKIDKSLMIHPMWQRYYKYKAMTPYADIERDNKLIEEYHNADMLMDKALIQDSNTYLLYKRYSVFVNLSEELPNMLNDKKLALWGIGADIEYIMAVLSTKGTYADVVIDGLSDNHGKKVFHYMVQNPEIIKNKNGEFFVLLCMRNKKTAAASIKILNSYGYNENDYHHVFKTLWNNIDSFHN